MLSYMLPIEEKPPLMPDKNHLQLDLDGERTGSRTRPLKTAPLDAAAGAGAGDGDVRTSDIGAEIKNGIETSERVCTTNGFGKRTIIKSQSRSTTISAAGSNTISTDSSVSSISSSDLPGHTPTDKQRPKLCINGGLKTSLKRVSFGSSKGSMVETLIYESPLAEEQESSPLLETPSPFSSVSIDSETPESKKVRVTFFESEKPLLLPSPDSGEEFLLDVPSDVAIMTSHSPVLDEPAPPYNRQASTESGWDNPFRPDGDLSREADEMVELIKGGKPITPTPGSVAPAIPDVDQTDAAAVAAATLHASPAGSPVKQGVNGSTPGKDKSPAAVEVQRGTVGQPIDASQVEVVNIKKKPKCKCCVIQ